MLLARVFDLAVNLDISVSLAEGIKRFAQFVRKGHQRIVVFALFFACIRAFNTHLFERLRLVANRIIKFISADKTIPQMSMFAFFILVPRIRKYL